VIAAAAWAWALLGIVALLVLGVLLMFLLGLAGTPGDALRRLGHRASAPREERGHVVPDEVPTATAEDTARAVDDAAEK
jgi:hypothetical protein